MQLRVLGLGLLQDWNVWIGVFPKREEIFVSSECPDAGYGLAWDGNGNFVGPANIQESITVSSDGTAYTGTFTVDQYDTDGNDIQHVGGNVAARRILVSTTIQEIYGW